MKSIALAVTVVMVMNFVWFVLFRGSFLFIQATRTIHEITRSNRKGNF